LIASEIVKRHRDFAKNLAKSAPTELAIADEYIGKSAIVDAIWEFDEVKRCWES